VAPDNCHYALGCIILMAHALGLGTCLLRTVVLAAEQDPEIQREILLPKGHKLFGCASVGFPKHKSYQMPARKEARKKMVKILAGIKDDENPDPSEKTRE